VLGQSKKRALIRPSPARNDARYQGEVSVYYPFHPLLSKQNLSVLRKSGAGGAEYLELHGPKVRQVVPAWMLDPDRCTQMTCGLQPTADLASLLDLAHWLRTVDTVDL
jgi:hypothetical protein